MLGVCWVWGALWVGCGAGWCEGCLRVGRGVCCGVVWCVMDRYHLDSLILKKCLAFAWHLLCGVPYWYFFAVTVPLQLEVSKLNVNMVTCNGCNGCVTVDVTVDLSSCAYVCAC